MNTLPLIAIILAISICWISVCTGKNTLKIGDKAPEFALMDKDGVVHTLSEWRGKKVALYFYPKDNTPGCTQQACSVRDSFSDLEQADIVVIGLSKGSEKSKTNFAAKHHLPFPLLLATDNTLKSYGVNGAWWTLYLPKRQTFLIDENGIIIDIIKHVDTKNHARQIIDCFKKSH